MEIQIRESRFYPAIGARMAGEIISVPDEIGKQLVEQRFAEFIQKPKIKTSKDGGQ